MYVYMLCVCVHMYVHININEVVVFIFLVNHGLLFSPTLFSFLKNCQADSRNEVFS